MDASAVPAIDRISVNPSSATGVSAPANVEPRVTAEAQPAQNQESQTAPVVQKFPDVGLKFLIDPTSKDLTVLMIDRSSHRVVRTIPPGELNKYKEGDLVDLFY